MKIAVSGISGKMGRTIASLIIQDSIAELSSGLVRSSSGLEGLDLGEFLGFEKNHIFATSNLDEFVQSADAVIDFSSPALSLEIAKKCAQYKKVLVCGTTGFLDEEKQKFASYAQETPIIWSSNMSLGVNLLMNLVEKVAGILRDDFDVEILEMHHNKKIDAPSGTALSLGSAVAKGRNVDIKNSGVMARVGKEAKRNKGEIGFATLRGGDVIGDHTVIFAGEGERLELAHKASSREIFAKGAIRACIWGSAQKSGFYSMRDVLN
ncbi:MAG: 4-hydroxy-tetrahydrodipicolinate reductase [Proteobacteria bacterium]|nr:4-hydroxy-tetrahydrodipicolinate reductase [Pseudomonadota bacterium]NCA28472.1 4-hydroxy-tetrahydrodipicolinate reductase [Pseudomonadota bacterium]